MTRAKSPPKSYRSRMDLVVMLHTLWSYKGFILSSAFREFQIRYNATVLGLAWAAIQPLAIVFIYTIIFSELMAGRLPGDIHRYQYSIYLCSGILTWGLFAEVVNRCQVMFLDNADLIKKIQFPKLTLPFVSVTISLIQFVIVFSIFLAFLTLIHALPGWLLLGIVPVLVVQLLFSVSLGTILGVLNVFFRDVGQMALILLQLWYWATPIVYPRSILPTWLKPWMNLNPMYHIMSGYQTIFASQQWPDFKALSLVFVLSLVLAVFAVWLFRRLSGDIVDEL